MNLCAEKPAPGYTQYITIETRKHLVIHVVNLQCKTYDKLIHSNINKNKSINNNSFDYIIRNRFNRNMSQILYIIKCGLKITEAKYLNMAKYLNDKIY